MFESFIGVNFWTALFVLSNTVALFLVLKKYLFLPVKGMIDSRRKEIDEMYADAGYARESAAALEKTYKEKLAAAAETGERIVKDAVARGQAREEEIICAAGREAAAIRDKATADIALEKKKALNDAKNEISDMAMAIAEKVVGHALSKNDQWELIDGFIRELGGQP